MVLDRWPDNFFAETEQVAYCPSHIVPGMDFSNDPLLQGRLFSYHDTQLSRLGSPNFHQLPINAPKCPFNNHQRDGHMQMNRPAGRVSYEPNSLSADSARESATDGFKSAPVTETGEKGRVRPESFNDHYSQARQFYMSQTDHEQAHIASALVFELSKVEHSHIREAIVGHLRHIDEKLAGRTASALGMDKLPAAPITASPVKDLPLSHKLRTIGNMKDTLMGRSIAVLISEGSDAEAINLIKKSAKNEGASIKIIAPRIGAIKLADGATMEVDGQLSGTPSVLFDAVALILTEKAAKELSCECSALDFALDAFSHLKAIAVDKGGSAFLKNANIKTDAGVVDAMDAKAFIKQAKTRQWDREKTVRTLA
jgi:catalase